MLLVNTTIAPSRIHGMGLFAAGMIRRGTPVWRFTPGFDLDLPLSHLDRLTKEQRDVLSHYGYVDPRIGRFILCCDDARFINHSDDPNLVPDFSQDRYGIDVAVRDIVEGEEITADYLLLEGHKPA